MRHYGYEYWQNKDAKEMGNRGDSEMKVFSSTGVASLKCCIKILLWDGLLARLVRAGCLHHKSYVHTLL